MYVCLCVCVRDMMGTTGAFMHSQVMDGKPPIYTSSFLRVCVSGNALDSLCSSLHMCSDPHTTSCSV